MRLLTLPPRTLIIVPTFNEAESLAKLLGAIQQAQPDAHELVVDDASSDGTGRIAAEISRSDARVHVLHRAGKLGLGTAYVAGFRWGLARGYERFVQMDADFSHAPSDLPRFAAELDAGADVVVGSRNVPGGRIEGWGPIRYLISKGGSLYARLVLSTPVRDMTTGFKAYTRNALELIAIDDVLSNGYAFQIETTYRAIRRGLRVLEIPIVFVDRREGHSKMTRREVSEAIVGVWLMRRSC
jgi:dolichol-phosphate mannosyltransferase